MGENEASTMGVNARVIRIIVIIAATLVTATSVCVTGMIGCVGLVIPHLCRMMIGADYRKLIPASMLLGVGFLLVVDDIARLATTAEIPIGTGEYKEGIDPAWQTIAGAATGNYYLCPSDPWCWNRAEQRVACLFRERRRAIVFCYGRFPWKSRLNN